MATVATQPDAEKLAETPSEQARDWFALGVSESQVVARLQAEYGLEEAEAARCFEEMIEKLGDDFESAVDRAEAEAAEFYRSIKHDPQTPWGARLKAQIDLERLLQLVARAAEPEGHRDHEVLEAFAFHEKLIAVPGPTPNQKLRSHSRRLLLLGIRPQPERRVPRGCSTDSSEVRPRRIKVPPASAFRVPAAPPSEAELQTFAREQLVRELTDNQAECQAVCRMLADSPPERAEALLEALHARHHGGARELPPSQWSPIPNAQPPPR